MAVVWVIEIDGKPTTICRTKKEHAEHSLRGLKENEPDWDVQVVKYVRATPES